MTSVREVPFFYVVFHVESPFDALKNTCAAAGHYRMLAASGDLTDEVGAIHVRGCEYVVRSERSGVSGNCPSNGLRSRLNIGAAL